MHFVGQNPDEEDEPPSKGKKGGGKRKQRQTVSTFYKAQLGKFNSFYRKICVEMFKS